MYTLTEFCLEDPDEWGTYCNVYESLERCREVVREQIFEVLSEDEIDADELWNERVEEQIDDARTCIRIGEILFVVTRVEPERPVPTRH